MIDDDDDMDIQDENEPASSQQKPIPVLALISNFGQNSQKIAQILYIISIHL